VVVSTRKKRLFYLHVLQGYKPLRNYLVQTNTLQSGIFSKIPSFLVQLKKICVAVCGILLHGFEPFKIEKSDYLK
jgi:hypothetical protein